MNGASKKATLWAAVALVAFSPLIGLEFVLATTPWLDERDAAHPVHIPQYLRDADRAIDRRNEARAASHPLGFNDEPHADAKPADVVRIAVLGDSFVFGDGLAPEQRWPEKFRVALEEATGRAVTVMFWGKNGWSTRDHLAFLEEERQRFDIDLLVIGYVANDLDPGDLPQDRFDAQKVFPLSALKHVFPRSARFVGDHVAAIRRQHVGGGYAAWVEALHAPDNVARWRDEALAPLAALVERRGLRPIFVLTPNDGRALFEARFAVVEPALAAVGADVIDCLPAVRAAVGADASRALWANPADGHPGEAVTTAIGGCAAEALADDVSRLPLP